MNKRILAFLMLFVLMFSSLSVFATSVGTENGTGTENSGTSNDSTGTGTENGDGTNDGTGTENGDETNNGTGTENGDETNDGSGTDTEDGDITDGEDQETLTIANGEFSLEKNSILTSNLPAIEGETSLVYVIVTNPTHGTLVHSDTSSASFTYTPELNYVGNDSFTFKVTKGEIESNIATIALTIKEPSEPIIPFNYIDMQNHWANYSASHLAARGLIIGEEIGSRFYFYPDRQMTRSEFLLFLLAITESNEDAELEIPNVTFADSTNIPSWLLEAAKLAYAKGIIKGAAVGNSIYLNPTSPITRTEAVVMINNILKPSNSTETLTYSDTSSIPEWGTQAVKNLTAYQIIQGSGTMFNPNNIISRAEAAEMSFKLIKQLEKDALAPKTPEVK